MLLWHVPCSSRLRRSLGAHSWRYERTEAHGLKPPSLPAGNSGEELIPSPRLAPFASGGSCYRPGWASVDWNKRRVPRTGDAVSCRPGFSLRVLRWLCKSEPAADEAASPAARLAAVALESMAQNKRALSRYSPLNIECSFLSRVFVSARRYAEVPVFLCFGTHTRTRI